MAMQVIEIHGLRRQLYRCEKCAGEAPPNLPANPVMLSVQERVAQIVMQPVAAVDVPRTRGGLRKFADTWAPYKENREPGEDG